MQRKKLTLVIVSLLVVVLSVSLAWFTTQIIGKGKDVSVTSANLQIVFTDSDGALTETDIEPGWSATKTFTIKNDTKTEYKYNIVIKDLLNTFVTEGYLQYKITSTNNGYNMTEFKDIPKSSIATDTILAYSVVIPNGVTQSYTIEFKYTNDESVDQSDDMGKKLSGTLFITEGTEDPNKTLYNQLLVDKSTVLTRTNFSKVLTDNNTNTLYTSTEDSKTVYYFAGIDGIAGHCEYDKNGKTHTVEVPKEKCSSTLTLCNRYYWTGTQDECENPAEKDGTYHQEDVYWVDTVSKPINNWVKFGKNASNQDLYWRIIRTNSDGGVRLLYHGTKTDDTAAYIGTSKFNEYYNDSKYVGYMYHSNGTNSTIKDTIDTWYKNNLTNYTKYLSTTAVYCNDRSTSDNTNFGARTRLIANKTPSYDCTATEDKFTADTSTGNEKLTYPIALMTADEVSFAGGLYENNAQTWYYYNSANGSSTGSTWWWLLSPNSWDGSYAYVFYVYGSSNPGSLDYYRVNDINGVRPTVSLKSCVKTSGGDGSASTPYTIKETSSGC